MAIADHDYRAPARTRADTIDAGDRRGCSGGNRELTEHVTAPVQRPATSVRRASIYDDAVAIVEVEYATELRLDDIARRIGASRRQLQRVYAEVGDTTFLRHLADVRLDRAAELLTRRPLSVRDVANRVGYRQPAQFAKAFRARYGLGPSAFRTRERAARLIQYRRP